MASYYQQIEFVEVPDVLQVDCPICLHTLKKPYLVECCGYRFCKTCIDPIRTKNASCPICRRIIPIVAQDKQLERQINERKVYCIHKNSGCQWRGELRILCEHLNEISSDKGNDPQRFEGCLVQPIECNYCHKDFRRDLLKDHELKSCPLRPVTCMHCESFTSTAVDDKIDQHLKVCDDYPLLCPNLCGETVKRFRLNQHITDSCGMTIKLLSNAYESKVIDLQKELQILKHKIISKKSEINHLSGKNFELSCKNRDLSNENFHLSEKNRQLSVEKDHLSDKNDKLSDEIDCLTVENLHLSNENDDLSGENDDLSNEIDQLNGENVHLSNENDDLSNENDDLSNKNDDLSNENNRLSGKILNLEGDVQLLKRLSAASVKVNTADDCVLVSGLTQDDTDQMIKSLLGQFGKIHDIHRYDTLAVVEFNYSHSLDGLFMKYHGTGIRLRGKYLQFTRLGD